LDSVEQADRIMRVITLSSNGGAILAVPDHDGWHLPAVAIPASERPAEMLTSAMRRQWDLEVVCLFAFSITSHRYQVAQYWAEGTTPSRRTEWVPSANLTPTSFADAEDYSAVERALDECKPSRAPNQLGRFARPGWFRQLRAWIEHTIAPSGLHLSDAFRQFNGGPSFSLIRFETSGPAIWFKAVGEPNLREFGIICALARLFPDFVPCMLATNSAWHGWLALEVSGQNLAEASDIAPWRSAAACFAHLQIASIANTPALLQSGVRDLREPVLSGWIAPFFEVITQLMDQQTQFPPRKLTVLELRWLSEKIQDALSALAALHIFHTLGSCDLNPGNVIVDVDRGTFLDWAEAYVGHPFFSFEYLLQHFRRGLPGSREAELTASYLQPWRAILPEDSIAAALAYAPLLAAFSYAAGGHLWREGHAVRTPTASAYLRALARRMYLEATKHRDWRARCCS
jgi:hypothetical protein